ncbi:MAG: hypothetical protein NC299_15520 [Lachnospiraceae bacterium]|nr:hypothetical protein [Ruminococcus sp.]MCM1276743.1 hypothetical protein [Lachnospiraceae bacterium]
MSKKSFITMMLLMLGDICLILGIILLCSEVIPLGIVAMAGGAVLIIAAIAAGRKKSADKKFSAGKFFKVLIIIAVSAALHIVGIVLMKNVNWIAGVAVMLIAFINLMFIIPAAKGFKKYE